MFLVFVLPAFGTWFGLGMPTERIAIGLLVSSVISGILVGVKELLGWKET